MTPIFQLLTPDFDIIQAIRKLIDDLPITVDIFHVKSHQDRDKPFDELTPYAKMNVLADRYAEYLQSQPETMIGIFPSWLPGTKAALFHGESQITSNIPKYIRQAVHEPPLRAYMINKSQQARHYDSKWNDQIYDTIAWDYIGDLLRKLPIGRRIQLSKFMHDLLPTAKRLQLSIIDMTDAVSSVANCGRIQIMSYNVLVMNASKQEVTHSKYYVNTFNDSTPL
jgi:hypothetical protein